MVNLPSVSILLLVAALGAAVSMAGSTGKSAISLELSDLRGGRLPIQGEGGTATDPQDFSGILIPVLARDTIRALDFPRVTDSGSASQWLEPGDLVLGIQIEDESRAYPLRIIGVHEVINDAIGGTPVVVTFCPLCFSGVAYDRRVDGSELTFGVSGFLLNSALVMYDRETDRLWAQISGRELSGDDAGQTLSRVRLIQTTWMNWRAAHPETTVIDLNELGHPERYPSARVTSYLSVSGPGLVPLDVRNDLDPSTLVAGIVVDGMAAAYELPQAAIRVVHDQIGDSNIVVVVDGTSRSASAFANPERLNLTAETAESGQVDLVDTANGDRWSVIDGSSLTGRRDLEPVDITISFWFGWAAYFPATDLWTASP